VPPPAALALATTTAGTTRPGTAGTTRPARAAGPPGTARTAARVAGTAGTVVSGRVGRREDRPGRRRVWAREQAREREEKERRSRPPSSASPCRPTSSCTRGPRAVPRQAGQRWSGWSRSPRQYPSQPRSRLCPNPPALGNCRCCYSQVLAVAVSEPLWPVPGWISSLGRQGSPWLDRGGQPGPAEPTRYMLTPTVLASSDASGVGGLLKARRCRARTTRRDGSRHNFDRPRPRKRGILRIRLPSRSTRDPA